MALEFAMENQRSQGKPYKPGKRRHGGKSQRSFKHQHESMSHSSIVRKQVDPEMAKYFTEIDNLFESNGVDLEERSVICGNAIEETEGKEYSSVVYNSL